MNTLLRGSHVKYSICDVGPFELITGQKNPELIVHYEKGVEERHSLLNKK
jgi:hypothetical protein